MLGRRVNREKDCARATYVQVQRQDSNLWFQRRDTVHSPGPLTDLSRIVSSSLPVNSVDVEVYMDKHGYEQVDGCLGF